jgi:hypothetical protein
LWFLQAAAKAPTIDDGFDLEKVRYVEAAWGFVDGDLASFGWVVAMRNGRRLYLEYTIDDTEKGRPEDLSVTTLAEGQTYPELDDNAGGYWYQPTRINEHLGLVVPNVGDRPKLN